MRWEKKLEYYLKGGLKMLWVDILFSGAVFLAIYTCCIIYKYFYA